MAVLAYLVLSSREDGLDFFYVPAWEHSSFPKISSYHQVLSLLVVLHVSLVFCVYPVRMPKSRYVEHVVVFQAAANALQALCKAR